MRAPVNKRSEDEIVADIIDHMGYFLKRVLDRPERERQRQRVQMHVRRRITDLRTAPLPFSGNQKKNVEYANDLRRQIDKLARTLERPPSEFFSSALFGERFWSLLEIQEQEAERTAIEFNPQTQNYIAQEEPAHLKLFLAELNRLRSRCDRIIGRKLGQHGNINYRKEHAAIASREILEDVASNTGTKLRLTDAPTGKFCLVASLLFEAATGKHNADMRRACKAVLRGKLEN
jgi:hypothetical protein